MIVFKQIVFKQTVFKRASILASVLLAMLLLVGFAGGQPLPAATCQDCHKNKSTAYQHCRTISPADRAARSRCFKKADRALERCLKTCK